MRIDFRLVDVFAERPFAGNRLLVVPESPADLDTATMQAIALEINFSESTFVTATRPDGYDVRIFTPDRELPFAGHPTIGTAFVLASEGTIGPAAIQACPAGEIPVEVDVDRRWASMRQFPPDVGREVVDRASVARAAGLSIDDLVEDLPVVPISTGISHVMVPIRDEAALRRAARQESAAAVCRAADDAESLYLFTVRGDGDVMARMFDSGLAIGEDPATGSAAGPLGGYLSIHGLAGMPGTVTVVQGELTGRPSLLVADVTSDGDGWEVRVSGGVQLMGEGAFEL
jgi:trans-2,3-dihydro-3-hydroxyanthranilate isomerase